MSLIVMSVLLDRGSVMVQNRNWAHGSSIEFPGGGVGKGESVGQAAQRALKIELGLEIEISPQHTHQILYKDRTVYYCLFVVDGMILKLKANRGQQFMWKRIESLNINEFMEIDHSFVEKLKRDTFPLSA